jgi:hypothetical protein
MEKIESVTLKQRLQKRFLALGCVVIALCFILGGDLYSAKAMERSKKRLLGDGKQVINYQERKASKDLTKFITKGANLMSPLATGSETCVTTSNITALPFNDSDTVVGAADNYDLATDATSPTLTACPTCTATGGASTNSGPRGAVYTGTGTGPDKAYKITFSSSGNSLNATLTPSGGADLALYVATGQCTNDLSDAIVISDTGVNNVAETVTISNMPAGAYNIVVDTYTFSGTAYSGPYTLAVSGTGTVAAAPKRVRADFNGDGVTDMSVFRPSDTTWYAQNSSAVTTYTSRTFGLATDTLVPGDYDGDRKTDFAVYRSSATAGTPDFFVFRSSDNTLQGAEWGTTGDIPVVADYDGDFKTDFAVFRPSTADWFVLNQTGSTQHYRFGISTDKPVPADYTGDGKADFAVFRSGTWYYADSTTNAVTTVNWGLSTDQPVEADYDGDNKDDIAVFRSSDNTWYIQKSSGGTTFQPFGASGDVPVPGDYDGDGRYDIAMFNAGVWKILRSNSGPDATGFTQRPWGTTSDVAIPRAYLPQ